MIEQLMSKI